ncbi:MAG: hypothetical protein LBO78_01325 [Rickettsiales bacterium]|jgi:myo-inositol-1(or 4)-monophosphatase|nr:hypothetical protein [Rickettsiales bacterium]
MENLSANLHIITTACQKAARFILRDFGEIEQLQSSISGAINFAVASKIKIEKTLVDNLLEYQPKFGILARGREVKGADISHRFIINAIDGFESYSRGIPMFSVAVALQEQKNIIASCIYNPVLDKMFYAERGVGAYVMESRMTRRIRVSGRRGMNGALVAASHKDAAGIEFGAEVSMISMASDGMSFAWLASGAIDGFVARARDAFDISAGVLLVREAGGAVRAFDKEGVPTDRIFEAETIVSENNYLQPDLFSIIIKQNENRG